MKYKNIIWDWNGTIVNDAWVFVSVMNEMLRKNKLPLTTLEHYRSNFCFPIEKYWKGLGFRFSEEEFGALNKSFIDKYQRQMFLPSIHGGLVKLFGNLKKQQFILSASEVSLLKKSVLFYNVARFFDGVYGVDNLNAVGKELVGHKILKEHNLNNKETLLIGDTEYDCAVAKGLGCGVVLVSYGHLSYKRLSKTGETVLRNTQELKDFLLLV